MCNIFQLSLYYVLEVNFVMLNVLIICNNIIQTQFLVNHLSQTIPEVRVCSIEFRGINSIKTISTKYPDLILLDLDLPDISGIEIIKFVEKNDLTKYLNSIVVLASKVNPEVKNNPYVYDCLIKPIDYTKVSQKIIQLIHEKNKSQIVLNKIENELTKLNFNFSHIGTNYLIECILILHKKNSIRFNLSKEIYPILAEKYDTNVNTIKCDILHSTVYSYYESEENFLSSYYRLYPLSKPKTKYIISTILSKL